METPTMLYKHPIDENGNPTGTHEIHGSRFDYIIVDAKDIEEHIKLGWSRCTSIAKEVAQKTTSLRDELETKAKELKIKIKKNMQDSEIMALIEEAIKDVKDVVD